MFGSIHVAMFMILRWLLPAVLLLSLSGDGAREGRKGNGLYKLEQYEQAAEQYRAGLAHYDQRAEGAVPAGLMNNLGAALHQLEDFEQAQVAFTRSALVATTDEGRVRAAYNTGNNAAALGDIEFALAAYREALLTDPTNEDAKFNYEFLKRQQRQQQQQQGSGQNQQQEEGQEQEQQDQQDGQQQNDEQQQDGQQGDQQQDPNAPEQQQEDEEQPPQGDREREPQRGEQLSRQQAQRILQALQVEEEKLLREVQKVDVRSRRVEKDW
jgi:tetratricopeptide (TPR) repeat protein